MLLHDKLRDYRLILASNSPRRRELMTAAELPYVLAERFECQERYPSQLPAVEVAAYLSELKSEAYPKPLTSGDILVTADTTVVVGGQVLGKPADAAHARQMLGLLSGREHLVVTGVTLRSDTRKRTFSAVSKVRFADLRPEQIDYYVERFSPLDKAGAYGIQEWIGYVGITGIDGSFYNVMGLPVQALCRELESFIDNEQDLKTI